MNELGVLCLLAVAFCFGAYIGSQLGYAGALRDSGDFGFEKVNLIYEQSHPGFIVSRNDRDKLLPVNR
jgi:hypothetical protein